MVMSVNTNKSAMIALQNLTGTNRELEVTQNRISTGMKVAGAKDNSAVYAIAQNMRGDIGALDSVQQSMARATSVIDVALAAGEAVSDLLIQMKEKVVAANDQSIDSASRAALNEDFQAIRDQITTIVENATFDGTNLVDGSLSGGMTVLANAEATNSISIPIETLTVGGSIITVTASSDVGTLSGAQAALTMVENSAQNVNAALARLGSLANQLDTHSVFLTKLEDQLTKGVGNLVDADLATESARLQALQVKQQLGGQSLSIANQAPQAILSLFN
ncbi:MAG: flagellin [Alphaproteobacteria bacterium]